jgi:lipopolysaccharide exporter
MIAAKGLLGSAVFSSGAKFLARVIGLISTLILARVLTPNDFAMVAIIAIVVYFFDIMSHTGSEQYIVQKSVLHDADLNTAWTLDILLKSVMFVLLLLLAPLVTAFFEQAHLTLALQISALTLVINALKSPGLLSLKRDLDYKTIFYLSLCQRLVSFVVVITTALWWQSYWAFIVADIAGALVFSLGSFFAHHYRPRFGLENVKQQWQFSQWLLGKSVVGYLRSQVDTVFVAKFFNAGQLGNYHMARDVAMLPGHNLVGPAIEPLLADFKDYKSSPQQLGERVTKALAIVALAVLPVSVYMLFFPHLIVFVLLGEQWQIASEILGLMSLLFFYHCFLLVIESALTALGKVKTIFIFDVLSLIAISLCLFGYLQFAAELNELLLIRAGLGIVFTLLIGATLHQISALQLGQFIKVFMLALTLSLVAAWMAYQIEALFAAPKFILLLATGTLFCGTYIGLLVLALPSLTGMNLKQLIARYRHQAN